MLICDCVWLSSMMKREGPSRDAGVRALYRSKTLLHRCTVCNVLTTLLVLHCS